MLLMALLLPALTVSFAPHAVSPLRTSAVVRTATPQPTMVATLAPSLARRALTGFCVCVGTAVVVPATNAVRRRLQDLQTALQICSDESSSVDADVCSVLNRDGWQWAHLLSDDLDDALEKLER